MQAALVGPSCTQLVCLASSAHLCPPLQYQGCQAYLQATLTVFAEWPSVCVGRGVPSIFAGSSCRLPTDPPTSLKSERRSYPPLPSYASCLRAWGALGPRPSLSVPRVGVSRVLVRLTQVQVVVRPTHPDVNLYPCISAKKRATEARVGLCGRGSAKHVCRQLL